jgi:hypothetical protein
MKQLLIPATFAVLLLLFSQCRKASSADRPGDNLLIQRARQFFSDSIGSAVSPQNANPRIGSPKYPLWDSAHILSTSAGKAVVVPLIYRKSLHIRSTISGKKLFGLSQLAHLLLYLDNHQQFHAELVTAFPDSTALQPGSSMFSGILFVEDWAGNRIHQYKYNPDGTILSAATEQGQLDKRKSVGPSSINQIQPTYAATTCYEISGYNYSPDDPDNGYAWTEPAGCITDYFPVTQALAPVGSPSPGNYGAIPWASKGAVTVAIPPPTDPIDNIHTYFNCFTNSPSVDHTYSVTVCVLQPVPGTRSPWGFTGGGSAGSSAAGNPFDTGHTFLIFSENSAGTIITRNVGFYPVGIVNPVYSSDQGVLDDNEKTTYTISISYNVSNIQFFSMLNYASIGNNPGYIYDLNSNNCTTFVLHALAAGDITLSSSQGVWPGGGHGYDPGDLGEDIRSMNLPSNVTRSTLQNPHPNQGSCN